MHNSADPSSAHTAVVPGAIRAREVMVSGEWIPSKKETQGGTNFIRTGLGDEPVHLNLPEDGGLNRGYRCILARSHNTAKTGMAIASTTTPAGNPT